jgi:trimethylamine:corrinoid methyltransferase-like protein
LAGDLYGDIYAGDHFLTSAETLRWFREEVYLVGPVVDRGAYDTWVHRGKKSAWDRARLEVARILSSHPVEPLADGPLTALMDVMKADARRMGIELPPLD